MKTKEIFFATLMNQSGDCGEPYRVINISSDFLYNGKDEQLKELLYERIDDFFNNDINNYFNGLITEDDVENFINDLVSHKDSSLGGEYFWWSDIEGLIVTND